MKRMGLRKGIVNQVLFPTQRSIGSRRFLLPPMKTEAVRDALDPRKTFE